jgi:hypothetical protein
MTPMSTLVAPDDAAAPAAETVPETPSAQAVSEARSFNPARLLPLALVVPVAIAIVALRRRAGVAVAPKAKKVEFERKIRLFSGNEITFSPVWSPTFNPTFSLGRRFFRRR